jgi:hypothetical protein
MHPQKVCWKAASEELAKGGQLQAAPEKGPWNDCEGRRAHILSTRRIAYVWSRLTRRVHVISRCPAHIQQFSTGPIQPTSTEVDEQTQ